MEKTTDKIKKRDRILSVAIRRFYDDGYRNTPIEQIARDAEVTAPLVNYHFGSKDNLAKAAMETILSAIKNKLSEIAYLKGIPYDLKASTVTDMLTFDQLWHTDQKARSFYVEFLNLGFETCSMEKIISFYKMHDRQYHLNIDRASGELSMLTMSAIYSYFGLQYSYFCGKLSVGSHEDFIEYVIRTQFRFMRFSEAEIDEIIANGRALHRSLNIRLEPYFEISSDVG